MSAGMRALFLPNYRECIILRDATIKDALVAISKSGALLAAVVDQDKKLIGIFTDGDARRAILAGANIEDLVAPHIKLNPVVAFSNAEPHELREMAISEGVREIPLVDNSGRLVDVFVIVSHEERVASEGLLSPVVGRAQISNQMFLIAGGKGTRLRTVVSDVPKPLANVGGQPIIQTIIENASRSGIRNFVVAVNYKAELIEEHLRSDKYKDLYIRTIREDQFLGTAGCIGLLGEEWSDAMIVSNADVLTNVSVDRVLNYHLNSGAAATCVVRPYHVQIPFGVVEVGAEGITCIREKPTHKHVVNTGIYVLSPVVKKFITKGESLDMPVLLQRIIDGKLKVVPYLMHEYWRDVGRPDEYALANEEYQNIFGR